jgi:hypothetical protein
MVAKKPIIGAVLAVGCAYAAYPYVTIYRLGQAIRQGDAPVLESMVDWYSVREGIKEDICDLVTDDTDAKSGRLPPFGASFVRGIAVNSVDRRVTPEALVSAVQQQVPAKPVSPDAPIEVSWAFFASPSQFVVDLRSPGAEEPIRVQMDFRGGAWQVTRVWLPVDLLSQARRTCTGRTIVIPDGRCTGLGSRRQAECRCYDRVVLTVSRRMTMAAIVSSMAVISSGSR